MGTKEKAAGAGAPSAASRQYNYTSADCSTGISGCNAPGDGLRKLLSGLEGVRRTGPGTCIARCPAHQDRRASLSLRELDDGRLLIHCFAECNTESVLAAVGLTFDALFPERALADHLPTERRPFPAMDVLPCVGFEALVVAVAACESRRWAEAVKRRPDAPIARGGPPAKGGGGLPCVTRG